MNRVLKVREYGANEATIEDGGNFVVTLKRWPGSSLALSDDEWRELQLIIAGALKKKTSEFVLPNPTAAKEVTALLIRDSMWFSVAPYPDDNYLIEIKDEDTVSAARAVTYVRSHGGAPPKEFFGL